MIFKKLNNLESESQLAFWLNNNLGFQQKLDVFKNGPGQTSTPVQWKNDLEIIFRCFSKKSSAWKAVTLIIRGDDYCTFTVLHSA